jgi:hypothetical protein
MLATISLVAVLAVGGGVAVGGILVLGGIPIVALLAGTIHLWKKKCRPTICQLLRALLAGSVVGALLLALVLLVGQPTPRVIVALLVSAGVTAAAAVVSWLKGCFR